MSAVSIERKPSHRIDMTTHSIKTLSAGFSDVPDLDVIIDTGRNDFIVARSIAHGEHLKRRIGEGHTSAGSLSPVEYSHRAVVRARYDRVSCGTRCGYRVRHVRVSFDAFDALACCYVPNAYGFVRRGCYDLAAVVVEFEVRDGT
jgi:hypothetical protein